MNKATMLSMVAFVCITEIARLPNTRRDSWRVPLPSMILHCFFDNRIHQLLLIG